VKIIYGSPGEKAALCGAFLLASAASALILLRQRILTFPFLGLPAYLAGCALVLSFLPRGQAFGSSLSRGLYRVAPALLLMGAIFRASSFTFPSGASFALPDLLFHFAEFSALGLLTARMFAPEADGALTLRSFLLAFSIVLAYGALDEIHQSFVPGRDPSGTDLLLDAAGGLLGNLAYPVLFTGPKKAVIG
jgi:hypothetical protein